MKSHFQCCIVFISTILLASTSVLGMDDSPEDISPASGTKSIIAYTQYADLSSSGEYAHSISAIRSVSTNYVLQTVSSYTQLASMLPGNDVLFIPEQESATSSALFNIGAACKTLLQSFVMNGGVIIVCDYAGKYGILTGAELLSIGNSYGASSRISLTIVNSSDPIVSGVTSPYYGENGTSYYTTSETGIVSRASGGPVVINKEYGLGNVVLIGHDYFESNTGQDRILGNAVFNLPSNRDSLNIASDGVSFDGLQGGPFSPANIVFTLRNGGTSSLEWSAAESSPWLNLSSAAGTLEAGSSTSVTVSLSSVAGGMRAGQYLGNIVFSNITSGFNQNRSIQLNVMPFKIVAPDGSSGDNFGYSVAIDGNAAIVGAHMDDDKGSNSGSAYIYRWTGVNWVQEAKLTASDGYQGDYFGLSVDISSDTVIVGACQEDAKGSEAGAAYIFQRIGGVWTQQTKLVASDGYSQDYFGYSVSIDGDTAVAGSYQDDDRGTNSGSIYVYKRTGQLWSQQTKLVPSDLYSSDNFGICVSIDGDTIIAGSYRDDDKATDSGSAYVFKRTGDTWAQQAKLTASDGYSSDYFGVAVSVSADTAIIGSYQDDVRADGSGSAYIFERAGTSWTQTAKLTASDGATSDYFGRSVSISGDVAVAGAYMNDSKAIDGGSAYIFVKPASGWASATETTKITAFDGASSDGFGFSVDASGELCVFGSFMDDDKGVDSGSVYALGSRVSLQVKAQVAPEDFVISGSEEGPFAPTSKTYIITNCGAETLNWSVSADPNWLTVLPMGGVLDPNASTMFEVTADCAVLESFAPGTYDGSIVVSDNTNDVQTVKNAAVEVIEVPGKIEVVDSIAEPDMPYGDVFVSLTKKENITITNADTNPRHELTINDIRIDNTFEVYSEDFSDYQAQGWNPYPSGYWQVLGSGMFQADGYSNNYVSYLASLYSTTTFKDGAFQATLRCQYYNSSYGANNSCGIVLRATDNFDPTIGTGSAYLVYIRGDRYFKISKYVDGIATDIGSMGWVYSGSLNFGTSDNIIKFVADDAEFKLYFNGSSEPVWSGSDSEIQEAGYIGVFSLRVSSSYYYDTYFLFDNVSFACNDVFKLSVSEDDFPKVLKSGESLVVDVNFMPADFVDYAANIIVESNDPNDSLISIAATGRGIKEYIDVTGEQAQFRGHPGGPFMPSTDSYNITNNGPVGVDWSLRKADWLDASAYSGRLEPGQTAKITVWPNDVADTMPNGLHEAELVIVDDTTTVEQSFGTLLTVYSLGKISISPAAFDIFVPQGTKVTETLNIGNNGDADVSYSLSELTYWLELSPDSGVVAPGQQSQITLTVDGTGGTGTYEETIYLESNDPYNQFITIPFRVTVVGVDDFVELFESNNNDLHNYSLTFTPNSLGSYYDVCSRSVTQFPIDPSDSTEIEIGDDDYIAVNLTGASAEFFGRPYETFYIGSNGYITFNSGDYRYHETIEEHFDLPRIAGLFDDLDPGADGARVSWKQLGDRVIVTFQNVPEMGLANSNNFQIEMFFNGVMRITWLQIDSADGLAGLSHGNGIPMYFEESNLSGYNECIPLTGDLNNDQHVNLLDIKMFSEYWARTQPLLVTVRDEFNLQDYSSNDGSAYWTTNWMEYGEGDGPASGMLKVAPEGKMQLGQKGTKINFNWSLTRGADLSSATVATFSYDYSIADRPKSGIVYVQVSSDDGLSWHNIGAYPHASAGGSVVHDISNWISADTQIRFACDPSMPMDMLFSVDNVQIEYGSPGHEWYEWCNGSDVNKDFCVDLADLIPVCDNWLK